MQNKLPTEAINTVYKQTYLPLQDDPWAGAILREVNLPKDSLRGPPTDSKDKRQRHIYVVMT